MPDANNVIRPGTYNIEYFSGAQVSIYIGHIWIDEVTSITYNVSQSRSPLYGYSDQLYRGLAQGQVLVRGQLSINFKEAGYLWLVLNEYQRLNRGGTFPLDPFQNKGSDVDRKNIEQVISKEMTQFELNQSYQQLVLAEQQLGKNAMSATRRHINKEMRPAQRSITHASLTGYASTIRSSGTIDTAEQYFEAFEDMVWGQPTDKIKDEEEHRRADDVRLNPFDIYMTYGDFADDNSHNHTIRKITDVSIIGTSQQVVIDGQPIQEVYDFIARNIV